MVPHIIPPSFFYKYSRGFGGSRPQWTHIRRVHTTLWVDGLYLLPVYINLRRRVTVISNSVIFLRKVLRLIPSRSAHRA